MAAYGSGPLPAAAVLGWLLMLRAAFGSTVQFSASDGLSLEGTLLLPASPAATPFPVAVFAHGTGKLGRDSTKTIFIDSVTGLDGNPVPCGQPNTPLRRMTTSIFRDLAEGLAARQIGSLRFDSRASSIGADLWKLQLAHHVEDVVSACEFASRVPGAGSVILIGHNQGAAVATVAASRCAGITKLVLLADTGRRIDEVFQSMLRTSLNWFTTLRDSPADCHAATMLALPTSPGVMVKNDQVSMEGAVLEFEQLIANLTEYTAALSEARPSAAAYFCSRGEGFNYLFLGKYPVCPLNYATTPHFLSHWMAATDPQTKRQMIDALPAAVRILSVNSKLDLQVKPEDYLPLHQMLHGRPGSASWDDMDLHHILVPANLSSEHVSGELIERLAMWLNDKSPLNNHSNTSASVGTRRIGAASSEHDSRSMSDSQSQVGAACGAEGSPGIAADGSPDTGTAVVASVVSSPQHQVPNKTETSGGADVAVQSIHPIFRFFKVLGLI